MAPVNPDVLQTGIASLVVALFGVLYAVILAIRVLKAPKGNDVMARTKTCQPPSPRQPAAPFPLACGRCARDGWVFYSRRRRAPAATHPPPPPTPTPTQNDISTAIQEGARAFLRARTFFLSFFSRPSFLVLLARRAPPPIRPASPAAAPRCAALHSAAQLEYSWLLVFILALFVLVTAAIHWKASTTAPHRAKNTPAPPAPAPTPAPARTQPTHAHATRSAAKRVHRRASATWWARPFRPHAGTSA